MRETQVRSLGRTDPLEKEIATHSSILAWKITWAEDQKSPDTPGSPEGNTEGPGTASSAQLEKNHGVPTSWQDEALAHDGVSREDRDLGFPFQTPPGSKPRGHGTRPCREGSQGPKRAPWLAPAKIQC